MKLPGHLVSLIETHIPHHQLPPVPLRNIVDPTFRFIESASVPRVTPVHLTKPQVEPSRTCSFSAKRILPKLNRLLQTSGPESALNLAFASLNKVQAPTGPSTLRKVRPLQHTYARLVEAFLNHPHGLSSAASLLSHQVEKGVPPTPQTLNRFLKLSLKSGKPTLPIIQKALPLLPEKLDLHLLTAILRALIRDVGVTPEETETMISSCLKMEGKEARRDWPWDLWDVLLLAHAKAGNFRAAVQVLGEFKCVVQGQADQQRMQQNGHKERQWTNHQIELICRPYTTVMALWSSAGIGRFTKTHCRGKTVNSQIAGRLAADLIQLLGDVRNIPLVFLNAWMTAERISGRYKESFMVWRLINGEPYESTGPGPDPALEGLGKSTFPDTKARGSLAAETPHRPDSHSWIALFKLVKNSDMQRTTSIRPFVADLISQSNSSSNILTTGVINSLLSAMSQAPKADLPLILHLLKLSLSSSTVNSMLNERSVDIVASCLTKAARTEQRLNGLFGFPFYRHANPLASTRTRSDRTRKIKSGGMSHQEWTDVSEVLHVLRNTEGNSDGANVDLIRLPLATPLAELVPKEDNHAIQRSTQSLDLASSTVRQLPTPVVAVESTVHSSASDHVAQILPAVIKLVEKAIVLQNDSEEMRAAYRTYRSNCPEESDIRTYNVWVLEKMSEDVVTDLSMAPMKRKSEGKSYEAA